MEKKEIKKELESLNSSLKMENNKGYFEVPKDYFEQMQNDVLQKVNREAKTNTNWRHSVIQRLSQKWVYAAAAIFVLGFGLLFLFDQNSKLKASDELLETEAIAAYLDKNIDDISMEMLIMDNDRENTSTLDQIETNAIQQYLEDNLEDIDYEDLENIL